MPCDSRRDRAFISGACGMVSAGGLLDMRTTLSDCRRPSTLLFVSPLPTKPPASPSPSVRTLSCPACDDCEGSAGTPIHEGGVQLTVYMGGGLAGGRRGKDKARTGEADVSEAAAVSSSSAESTSCDTRQARASISLSEAVSRCCGTTHPSLHLYSPLSPCTAALMHAFNNQNGALRLCALTWASISRSRWFCSCLQCLSSSPSEGTAAMQRCA
mmetsp:Transcript_20097/g.57494  ORF Transcript_20097/g.57494 Transcript_20097/m.57494 type:complete len:214 (-) Transcript_20097:134-775(-)